MKKNKVRIFSASEKTGIVLELIKEESTVAQLASKYAISSKTIQNWKKQFLGNAALAFEPAKVLSEYQEQINNLQEQNDDLAKALGKITVERDCAMGKLKSLDLLNKKSLVQSKLHQLPKFKTV